MATTPKQPQDRLPAKQAPAEQDAKPEGWELLKPFDQVPVWDQVELLELIKPLIPEGVEDGKPVEVEIKDIDFRIVGELAKRLQNFAVEREAYLSFVSGPGALEHAMNLGIAYAMQLGESERSASS